DKHCDFNGAGFFLELPLQEIIRYTKGSVREHNLLKNQFVHTKFLLNPVSAFPAGWTKSRIKPL
ncbi:MAG: hypothetical protein J6B18_05945, partial [Bacteroidaceae bacterium]|nr:hypothetical protein [Bacteroidaceae bacterium]